MACRRLLRADAVRCPADGAAPEDVETLPRGARLGSHRIDRMLGQGGMGFVYEATHEVLNRRTAIKMLRPELAKVGPIVTRFLNEAKAVNLIAHENIVNVYDYGDGVDGSVYFVMEFLEGQTLGELMRERQPMQVPLCLHVFGQIARALDAAHRKKIVHRDLKPPNVFVIAREDNPYFIKLLDFGIAQLRGEGAEEELTAVGTVMGTPQYMSPEQILGGAVDARTDVWALGVMLYRAATGQVPFKGERLAELTEQILHHALRPPSALVPLPATLSKLIERCLERRIDARCQSMSELLAGFERVKQEQGLDDHAILAAVRADAGVAPVPALAGPAGPQAWPRPPGAAAWPAHAHAHAHAAVSAPAHAAVPAPAHAPTPSTAPASRRSRIGLYVGLGALAGGLGSAAFVALGRGDAPVPASTTPPSASTTPPGASTTPPSASTTPPGAALVPPGSRAPQHPAAGDRAGWRAAAERDLRGALADERSPQQQVLAVDALEAARVPAGAPLLYAALKASSPEVRVKAARALGELALPDSAPRVRDALADAGDKLKIELAAVLYRLGDKDARAILRRALDSAATRLTAAVAMAEAGDDAGRAALAELLVATPAGREPWRRAAGALARLGDAKARGLLAGELVQPDAARAVGAAELLARAGDAAAKAQLARNLADPEFARPGSAAVALARLGDRRGLGWVPRGLASANADERKLALAVCGALAADAAVHATAIARLAAEDPDPRVRMTAEAVLLGL